MPRRRRLIKLGSILKRWNTRPATRESYRFHHLKRWLVLVQVQNKYMTKLKQKYLEYLQTDHWYKLRADALERDHYRCTICGSGDNLQGHHIRYRKNLFLCTLRDIQTLCKKCHEALHELKKEERRQNRKPRKPKEQKSELTVDRTGHLTIKRPKRKHEKPTPPQKKRSPYRFFSAGGSFVTLDNRLIYQPRL